MRLVCGILEAGQKKDPPASARGAADPTVKSAACQASWGLILHRMRATTVSIISHAVDSNHPGLVTGPGAPVRHIGHQAIQVWQGARQGIVGIAPVQSQGFPIDFIGKRQQNP